MPERSSRSLEQLAEAGEAVSRHHARRTAAAVAEQRLQVLERDLQELRGRVNGLVFVLLGAVATQVILRFFG